MNITVLDGYTLNPGDLSWEGLAQMGNLTVYDRTLPGETLDRALEADIIFTNKVVLSREIISKLNRLKFIGVLATGYNVVDVEAAREHGIVVTNIPAYSTASVAQMVFAHILNFTQQVGLHARQVRDGEWSSHQDFCFWKTPQTELEGKTLGIIGFGRIGRQIARLGDAFGMKVIFHNRSVKPDVPQHFRQTTLGEVFSNSDFLSINCPLTPENQGFINEKMLSLMKPSAFLINTGRGPLINEPDLANALNSGRIAGAGLDVLSVEPPDRTNPLLSAMNCYITPHIAWATLEARVRLMKIATENLRAFISGKPINTV
ncbi:MAG: D-2-hydroxyacid dehydrogenase [Bacteroidota bacterium]